MSEEPDFKIIYRGKVFKKYAVLFIAHEAVEMIHTAEISLTI